ncbi:RNA-directed DNA polymerase from mobile element jockey, partial [Stegodyphus mimosarum]
MNGELREHARTALGELKSLIIKNFGRLQSANYHEACVASLKTSVMKPSYAQVVSSSTGENVNKQSNDCNLLVSAASGLENFTSLDVKKLLKEKINPTEKKLALASKNCNRLTWAMDANSKSEICHSPVSDSRGVKLCEFFSMNNLFVVNEYCGPTLCSTQGSSYIDITVVGSDLLADILRWRQPDYESLSDHCTIEFELSVTSNNTFYDGKNSKTVFSVKKANWNIFYNACKQSIDELSQFIECCTDKHALNSRLENFVSILYNASKASMPLKKPSVHKVPWWSTKIECMRKQVNAAGRIEISGIYLPSGNCTKSLEETTTEVLNRSFLTDPFSTDNSFHRRIIAEASLNYVANQDSAFTMSEINSVIENLKCNKAPGLDSISNEILKQVNRMFPILFSKILNICLKLGSFPRCWRRANVVLIPKNSGPRIPHLDNLRCSSLLPRGLNRVSCNTSGLKSNVIDMIYKQGIVSFICYESRVWGTALEKKINSRILRRIQRRILLRVVRGYRTSSYEACFVISGFPPIDLHVLNDKKFKDTISKFMFDTKALFEDLPHAADRLPIQIIIDANSVDDNFPVVCYTDGSKIKNRVGLAYVVLHHGFELEYKLLRIPNECSVFQAELLCISESIKWISNNYSLSAKFLIRTDSLSSLYSLRNIFTCNKLIVTSYALLKDLNNKGVDVIFSYVRGHTGNQGNERADWLAKQAANLQVITPMILPK